MAAGELSDRGRWLTIAFLCGIVVAVLAYVVWPRGGDDPDPTLREFVLDCDHDGVARTIEETGLPGTSDDLLRAIDCDVGMVRLLLDAGASPDARDATSGETALAAAADRGSPEAVQALIDSGADVNASSRHGRGALHQAAGSGSTTKTELLLGAGASVEAEDDEGNTPLMSASAGGHEQTVELLLAAGADPNQQDDAGDTAMLLGANGGHVAVVEALLAGGADPEVASDQGHTPVLRAVAFAHPDVLELLLANGANPGAAAEVTLRDVGFVWGVRSGDLDFEELDHLVATLGPPLGLDDALVTAAAGDGLLGSDPSPLADAELNEPIGVFTPLYLAAAFGDEEMVRLLLDAGADPAIGTVPSGHLPAEAAALLGYADLSEMLGAA